MFSDKSPSSEEDANTKGHKISTSNLHKKILKINNGRYKYKNVDNTNDGMFFEKNSVLCHWSYRRYMPAMVLKD
jgi:hypothetical protein